jgi:hypothetical protein
LFVTSINFFLNSAFSLGMSCCGPLGASITQAAIMVVPFFCYVAFILAL